MRKLIFAKNAASKRRYINCFYLFQPDLSVRRRKTALLYFWGFSRVKFVYYLQVGQSIRSSVGVKPYYQRQTAVRVIRKCFKGEAFEVRDAFSVS